MPLHHLPLEEIDESIVRPSIFSIAKDVALQIGLSDKTEIIFKGQSPQVAYRTAEINTGDNPTDNNRYELDQLITIEYEMTDNETTLQSTPIFYPDEKPLFEDSVLGVYLHSTRASKRVTVRFKIEGSEKLCERIYANMKRLAAQGMNVIVHTIDYHIPVPKRFMTYLVDVHDMREANLPLNETLGLWFKRCFRPTLSTVSANGSDPTYVIAENQSPIQGFMGYGYQAPVPEKNNQISRYSINFEYTFYFDCPFGMSMVMPVSVHNQISLARWLPVKKPIQIDFIRKTSSYSQDAFNAFRFTNSDVDYTYLKDPGIPIPYFDDWIDSLRPDGYISILRILSKLDQNNLKKLGQFRNLFEWKLNPTLVDFILKNRSLVTRPYATPVLIQAYQNNELLDGSKITITDDCGLRYADDLNPRKQIHWVLLLCAYPGVLNSDAFDTLSSSGCFLKEWLLALYPGLQQSYGWVPGSCTIGSSGDTMDVGVVKDVFNNIINPNGAFLYSVKDPGWCLVGNFSVIAKRRNDEEVNK